MNGYLISRGGDFKPPTDGWVQVLALGDFPNAEAGITQHVDSEAFDAILDDFEAQSGQENWPGMLVDFDHFSHSKEHATEAAAWIDSLERRGDELWAHWRLTATGEKAVCGGDYRLTSSVLSGFTAYEGAASDKHMRPTKLVRVALTNDPNIKGMAPVSNRGPAEQANTTTTNREGTTMADGINHAALLKELLGLTEGASDEDIQKAIDLLKADAEADAGPNPDNDGDEDTHPAALEGANRSEVEALEARVVALNRENAEARAEQFFTLVGEDKDVREAMIELLATNREAALRVFKAIKPAAASTVAVNRGAADTATVTAPIRPAFNRRFQPNPEGAKTSDDQQEVDAVKVRLRTKELFAQNRAQGMTYQQCWNTAERELRVAAKNGEKTSVPAN